MDSDYLDFVLLLKPMVVVWEVRNYGRESLCPVPTRVASYCKCRGILWEWEHGPWDISITLICLSEMRKEICHIIRRLACQ